MPSLNWFTLNRPEGGPTLFSSVNRSSAWIFWNEWLFGVVIAVASFITVLLLLSPTYKHRWKTVSLVITSLLMGGAFLLGYSMPWWQSAEASIRTSISIRDGREHDLHLGVHIGLNYVNITMVRATNQGRPKESKILLPRLLPRNSLTVNAEPETPRPDLHSCDIYFNEYVRLDTANGMRHQMREALIRGLPVPILTVLDYLTHQEEGFRWSVDYRLAGFACQFLLTLTLISWVWMNIFFLVIPEYGALAMATTGCLALVSVFLYWTLLPPRHLVIHISGQVMTFCHGKCFWIILTTGCITSLTGLILWVVEVRSPGTLTFDLLLDNGLIPESKTDVDRESTESVSLTSSSHLLQLDATKKQDSGISSNSTVSSDLQSSNFLDDLDKIATSNGSYLQSSISSMIEGEEASQTFSYTFRCGQELPSFHESTISLVTEAGGLHSVFDVRDTHRPPCSHGASGSAVLASSEYEDWHDAVAAFSGDVIEEVADSVNSRSRRRSIRLPSVGSHRDLLG